MSFKKFKFSVKNCKLRVWLPSFYNYTYLSALLVHFIQLYDSHNHKCTMCFVQDTWQLHLSIHLFDVSIHLKILKNIVRFLIAVHWTQIKNGGIPDNLGFWNSNNCWASWCHSQRVDSWIILCFTLCYRISDLNLRVNMKWRWNETNFVFPQFFFSFSIYIPHG